MKYGERKKRRIGRKKIQPIKEVRSRDRTREVKILELEYGRVVREGKRWLEEGKRICGRKARQEKE